MFAAGGGGAADGAAAVLYAAYNLPGRNIGRMFVAQQSDGPDAMLAMLGPWYEEHGIDGSSPQLYVTLCYPDRTVIHHGSEFNMGMPELDFHRSIYGLMCQAIIDYRSAAGKSVP